MKLDPVSPGEAVVGLVFFLIFATAVLISILVTLPAMVISRRYAKAQLKAHDQVANALIGRRPELTISSGCGRRIKAGTAGWFCKTICRALHKIEPGHCVGAYEDDIEDWEEEIRL